MKRKLISAFILAVFSIQAFGQAIISNASEINENQTNETSAIGSNTPGSNTPVATGTTIKVDSLKDVGSYKDGNFEYNVVKDDTHKYIELSYYIGNEHSVTIPDNIDGIPVEVLKGGVFAFNKCDIYDVTIPESVKLIEYRAFDGTIEKYKNCYYGSAGLRNVKILGKDTKLEDNAFYNCGHLINVEADNNLFNNSDCTMFVNSSYSSNGATQIASTFQSNNTKSGLFILGDKLVYDAYKNGCNAAGGNEIYSYARKKIVPEGIKVIGKNCFMDSRYKTIIISNSVEKIESGAFKNCKIQNIYIPNKDVVIEDGAFDSSVKIYKGDNKPADQNILSYSYTSEGVLNGYFGDEKVVQIPSEINGTKITSIGGEITELEYEPQSPFKSLGGQEDKSVFSIYNSAEKVIIPEGVTEIKDYSFYYCQDLKEVVIPSTVTKISEKAFVGCNNLIKVTTSNKNIVTDCKEYKDAVANDGKEKQNQNIYNGYEYFNDYKDGKQCICISGYVGTDKKLVIPDKINDLPVTSIVGINDNKDIEEVDIPESITNVWGFENCTALSKVSIKGNPSIDEDAFKGTPYLNDMYKNNNGLFIFNKRIVSIQDGIDALNIPASVEEVSIDTFKRDFKEIDFTSSTKVKFIDDSNHEIICKTLDDYKEFAKKFQNKTDYYFTLKLDGQTIWSNETGTDVSDKNTPERYDVKAHTADTKNMLIFLLLPASLALVFKFRQKVRN